MRGSWILGLLAVATICLLAVPSLGPANALGPNLVPAIPRPGMIPSSGSVFTSSPAASQGQLTWTEGAQAAGAAPQGVTSSTFDWIDISSKLVTAPSVRTGEAYTWDNSDGYLLLNGGQGNSESSPICMNDTWTFIHGVWTNISAESTTAPSKRWQAAMVYDPVDHYVLYFGGTSCSGEPYSDTWKFSGGKWTNITSTVGTPPSPRWGSDMVWDPVDGYVMLIGGATDLGGGATWLGDTWKFSGGTWTSLGTQTYPGARNNLALAWDPVQNEAIGYAGSSNGATGGATWGFSGGTWSLLPASGAPTKRYAPASTYDPLQQSMIMFGGGTTGGFLDDTWLFQNDVWTEIFPNSAPGAWSGSKMVFDPVDGYDVLFGGNDASFMYEQTWVFDTLIAGAPTATPNPTDVGIKTALNVSIQGPNASTYLWSGLPLGCSSVSAPQMNCTPTSPVVTNLGVTVTDPWGLVLVSPTTSLTVNPDPSINATSPTLATDVGVPIAMSALGARGTPPYRCQWYVNGSASSGATSCVSFTFTALTPGPRTVYVVLNDSVGFQVHSPWLNITVNPLPGVSVTPSSLVGDVGLSLTLSATIAGGTSPFGCAWYLNQTLVGGAASCSTFAMTATTPGPRSVYLVATDSVGKVVHSPWVNLTIVPDPLAVLAGGPSTVDVGLPVVLVPTVSEGVAPYTCTWFVNGTQDGSAGSCASFSYVPATPGPRSIYVVVSDALGFRVHSAWTNITVVPDPTVTLSGAPAVVDLGQPVNLTAAVAGGTPVFLCSWYVDGKVQGTPTACSTWSYVTTSTGSTTVYVVVNDSLGSRAHSAWVNITVNPLPTIASFLAYPPVLDLGGSTGLSVVASGGTGALSYTFSALPPGCTTVDDSSMSCKPTATGEYAVGVTVRDARGVGAFTSLSLLVNPPLGISSFTAAPTSLNVGQSLTLKVELTGGTAPYTYTYLGLPDGCTTSNDSTLTCSPGATGSYLVLVRVQDQAGGFASATLNLTVTPAPPSSSFLSEIGGPLGLGLLLAVALVVLVVLAALWRGRRKREEPSIEPLPYPIVPLPPSPDEFAPDPARNPPPTTAPEPPIERVPPSAGVAPPGAIGPASATPPAVSPATVVPVAALAPSAPPGPTPGSPGNLPPWPKVPISLLEVAEVALAWKVVAASKVPHEDLMVVSTEPPARLEGKYGLAGAKILRLSEATGEGTVAVKDLDAILAAVEAHLKGGDYRAVVLADLDHVLDATSAKDVVRLVQGAKVIATKSRGRVLAVVDPEVIAPVLLKQLEEGVAVLRAS